MKPDAAIGPCLCGCPGRIRDRLRDQQQELLIAANNRSAKRSLSGMIIRMNRSRALMSRQVGKASSRPSGASDQVPRSSNTCATGIGLVILAATLAGCAPPTDVIDLRDVPQVTRDAMLQMPILPLGIAAPAGVVWFGQVEGYGCGNTPVDASSAAIQQLQIKALMVHAAAVVNVLMQPTDGFSCNLPYGAIATGTTVRTS
jgi:hypothetical protein